MSKIVVMNHMSLDGVIQAPGRPDEDTRNDFTSGGWASKDAAAGQAMGQAMGERMAAGGGLTGWIFGRRTYEDVLGFWTQQPDNPFGAMLVGATKYVVSTSLSAPFPYANTNVFEGDVADAVRKLKADTEGVWGIMGSSEVTHLLQRAGLVDEYLLAIHPFVFGRGIKQFSGTSEIHLQVNNITTTETGVVIASYQPAQ